MVRLFRCLFGAALYAYALPCLAAADISVAPYCSYLSPEKSQGHLNLCSALESMLKSSAALKAGAESLEASSGRVTQAGLVPNPTLNGEMDQRNEEVTATLSQTIEWGGKRSGRTGVAKAEQSQAQSSFDANRFAIVEEAKQRFIDLLLVQERVTLAQRRHGVAREIEVTAQKRLDAGRGMSIESIKAGLAVTASDLEVSRLQAQLANAKRQLAAVLGVDSSSLSAAEGDLSSMPIHPDNLKNLDQGKSPRWLQANAELETRKASLQLERSTAIPDLTLSAGSRYFKEERKTGLILGVSLPLPLFDRNQGQIQAAQREVKAAEFSLDATQRQLDADLQGALQEFQTAYAEANAFKTRILPAAEKAFASANEVYQRGKLDYLNVLDAQRDLFAAQEQYYQALVSYHKALAELERLTGHGATELIKN